jgi:hypothetical protein
MSEGWGDTSQAGETEDKIEGREETSEEQRK